MLNLEAKVVAQRYINNLENVLPKKRLKLDQVHYKMEDKKKKL